MITDLMLALFHHIIQICDIETLLSKLTVMCPKLRYLSLLGNQACPHEMLGGGHDDEDYQRYR